MGPKRRGIQNKFAKALNHKHCSEVSTLGKRFSSCLYRLLKKCYSKMSKSEGRPN